MIGLVLAAAISWPQQYNAGVAAYRSNDFARAATAFEQATASPDRTLQQRAFYNLGNTAYRLGQSDPTKAQPLWERAIKNYESALALEPNDADAKYNLEFVKKKLEELKQQQQQQQQNQKNQNEQQQRQEQKQDQQQQQQQQQQSQEKQPEPPQPSEQTQPPQEQKEQPPQPVQAGNLDRQQARALLDNLREDERNWNFFPEVQMQDLKDAGEPAKDW